MFDFCPIFKFLIWNLFGICCLRLEISKNKNSTKMLFLFLEEFLEVVLDFRNQLF